MKTQNRNTNTEIENNVKEKIVMLIEQYRRTAKINGYDRAVEELSLLRDLIKEKNDDESFKEQVDFDLFVIGLCERDNGPLTNIMHKCMDHIEKYLY